MAFLSTIIGTERVSLSVKLFHEAVAIASSAMCDTPVTENSR